MSEPAQIIYDKVDRMECPSCHTQIDVGNLPAFTKAICPSCGSEVTVPGRLGNYLLLNCLGSGGMGSVYRAYDETLARIVAIKVMLKSLGDAPEFLESFRREAQAAAKLNHPNIAQIYSFGQEKGQPYIVMELVGGKHFDEMIAQPEPLDQAMVMKIGMDIADGLQLAAASNLIHGDIKPENILLDERDTAKLLDFGIASSPNAETTEIWGTPYYIAPEKLKRQRVDFRSDIYCLGGTLYHALTQHPPFEGEDAIAVVKARLEHPPEPMKTYRPDIDPEVEEIIDRMLQVEPAMRYPTYGSLLSDMRRYLSRVQPQMPSASAGSNKRVIIKGRGKGAGSASSGSGAPSGKHHISVSRGMVDPKTITGSHNPLVSQDEGGGGRGKMIGEDNDSQKGDGKSAKGCFIAFGIIVALLALGGGGFLYYLKSQNKKAVAEYAEQVGKRDAIVADFVKLRTSAEKLRDETMAVYLGEASNLVAQAIAAVEAEGGAEFIARIIHEVPEETEEVPPDKAAEDGAAEDGAKEDEAKDDEAKDGEAAAEDGAKDEAKDGEKKAEDGAAEDKPAEEEAKTAAAAEEKTEEEAPAEEPAPDEPTLEGIPLLAREVFEALTPIRRAGRQTMRICDQVTMAAANAEASAQKIARDPSKRTADVRDETKAAASVVETLKGELTAAKDIYQKAQEAVDALPGDIRKAKAKLNELLGEAAKLTAERKRRAEEEAKAQRAREAEEARLAEQQRVAAEKQGQIGLVIQTAASNLENLRAFKYDQVLRELRRLDEKMTYPESKKALELAIKRVECLKELKAFLIEQSAAIPFAPQNSPWSLKSATEHSLEIVTRNGKDHITWDKMTLKQMVPLITFYLDNEENGKTLKLRQRVDALRNAAIYYMTFAADNPGARNIAKKYLAEVVEKLPSRAKEIQELLPELKMEPDGGL